MKRRWLPRNLNKTGNKVPSKELTCLSKLEKPCNINVSRVLEKIYWTKFVFNDMVFE